MASILLVGVSLFLPVAGLLDALSSRFTTVRSFRVELAQGFGFFRVACAINGILVAVLPWLLRRFELGSDRRVSPGRGDALAATALYAITFGLALPGLSGGWQLDEWRNMDEYLRFGFVVTLTRTVEGDNHVLYNLMAALTTAILGPSPLASRLPALLLSPLALPLLMLRLRGEFGRSRAFLACLPLTGFPLLVQYTHEGRAYGPLFAVLAALLLLRDDALHGSIRSWILFVLLGIAAVWLHLYAAAAVVALTLSSCLDAENRRLSPMARNAAFLAFVAGLSFLLYSPHLPHYLFSLAGGSRVGGFDARIPRLGEILAGPAHASFLDGYSAPWLFCALLGSWSARREGGSAALVTGVLTWILVGFSGSGQYIRYYVPTLALALLPSARAIAAAAARRPAWGAALGTLLAASTLAGVFHYYRLGNLDYRGMAGELRVRMEPGERVAGIYDGRPLAPYLDRPIEILGERTLMERSPAWFVVIDHHLEYSELLRHWIPAHYDLQFQNPSIRGILLAFRKKDRP